MYFLHFTYRKKLSRFMQITQCPSAGGAIRFYFVGSGKVVPVPPKVLVNRRISAAKFYGNGYFYIVIHKYKLFYTISFPLPSGEGYINLFIPYPWWVGELRCPR